MIRRTLGELRTLLAGAAGTTGMPIYDARFPGVINKVIEELMNEADWPGVVDRWYLRTTSGRFVLPPNYDRIMSITIDGVPQEMRPSWFQFCQYGPGLLESECCQRDYLYKWCDETLVIDQGETVTHAEVPRLTGPWFLRVYGGVPADDGEDQPYLTAQGTDGSGLIIRSQITTGSGLDDWINGERIVITDGSGYYQSTQAFQTITAINKPQTNGYVRLTGWNGTDEIELSNYEPMETVPSYRRYFSPWVRDWCFGNNTRERCVVARCRRRYQPLRENTDVAMISNLPALEAMMIAQWKRNAGNNEWVMYKQTAIDIMKKEAVAYNGRSKVPSITFQRGFGIGTLPYIR